MLAWRWLAGAASAGVAIGRAKCDLASEWPGRRWAGEVIQARMMSRVLLLFDSDDEGLRRAGAGVRRGGGEQLVDLAAGGRVGDGDAGG